MQLLLPTRSPGFQLSSQIQRWLWRSLTQTSMSSRKKRKITKEGFIRNNRGICDGKDLPEDILSGIYDRVKRSPLID